MCTLLERIETAGPGSKARRLVFDDGLDPRLTSAAAVKELHLEPGMELTRETLEDSLKQIEYTLARERALRLLGYREHSSSELRRKLLDNGYPADVAAAVTDRFVDVELVDDRRFALIWTRSRLAAGYGPRRIEQELTQRGIDPILIEETFAETVDPATEVARARDALRGRVAADRAGRDKLVRRLVSRGFSLAVALGALEVDEDADCC